MMRTHRAGVQVGAFALCVAATLAAARVLRAQAEGPTEKPARVQAAGPTVEALFVSDIHLEPFWDPARAARLKAAPLSEWKAILSEPASADQAARLADLLQTCKVRGADTSYPLYESSLRAIHEDARGAEFVVLSGDLISHDFSCKFKTLFPNETPAEYREFVEKTIEFVMRELRAAMPGVPIYAALGNNDSDCGDYQLDPDSVFLAEAGKILVADLPPGDRAEAQTTFAEGGYYSARLPAPLSRTRILVLDDLFMARQYATCDGKADAAPATAQIAWLEQQLNAARRSKEKVWVMSHIPPGVNPYATAIRVLDLCTGGKPQMFLSSEALPEAMEGYGDVVALAIFAHTHMDEMRLLMPPGGGLSNGVAIKVVGSISPINGNNPSFTVAEIDGTTAELKDYQVFVASNSTGMATSWNEEYDFAKTYKKDVFNAATAAELIGGFKSDSAEKDAASRSYIQNYGSGSTARALGTFWQPYTCALTNIDADAFRSCVCGN